MNDRLIAVSVIVPAYGVAHLLHEALDSLLRQNFRDWEAIVIDDGAPDDVEGALSPYSGDPRIRFLRTDNGGLATARNRAIAAARAPLVALLDGDDLYEPDYLTRMIAAIDADPRIGFVTCDARLFGDPRFEGLNFSRNAPQALPITLDRVLTRQFNIFVGCTIRRQALDAVGAFDGTLRSSEDFDLWLRLLAAGWEAGYVAHPLVRYRRREGSLSSRTRDLLGWTERVYEKAHTALAGRPEQASAARMLALTRRNIAWIDGETLIRTGRWREGVAMLDEAHAEQRSMRWRIAMPVMRRMPWIAPLLFGMRPWLPEISR